MSALLYDEPVPQSVWTLLVGVRVHAAHHRRRVEVAVAVRRTVVVVRRQNHHFIHLDDRFQVELSDHDLEQTGSKGVVDVVDLWWT